MYVCLLRDNRLDFGGYPDIDGRPVSEFLDLDLDPNPKKLLADFDEIFRSGEVWTKPDSEFLRILLVFTAQCTLVQMRGLGIACRPSVCLSVCNVGDL